MNPSRRSVLVGGGATAVTALAGCLGDDEGSVTVEQANAEYDEETEEVVVTMRISVGETPTDVDIEVTTLDEDGDTVDELSHSTTIEGTLEDDTDMVVFTDGDASEEFEEFEYSVEAA